jgi:proline iminopeptidase
MLFPPIAPYRTGFLDVGSGHRLYWDESGEPSGVPALVVHGGPGAGCTEFSRRWFDPRRYRIITFDQRGCGRSTPHAGIEKNTTAHLLSDLETLRNSLGIDRWTLMGRSWGATLALAYAERWPERVSAMLLNAVFTARRRELEWLYAGGAAAVAPTAWSEFIGPIGEHNRWRAIEAYYELLTCGDPAVELAAARSWCQWEDTLATASRATRFVDERTALARARIGSHYFVDHAFLEEGELVANAHRLRGVLGHIVQGCDDLVTPPATARELHRAWPQSRLQLVPGAGHASSEPGIMRALIDATDALIPVTRASRRANTAARHPRVATGYPR